MEEPSERFWRKFDEHVKECSEDKKALREEIANNTSAIQVMLEGKMNPDGSVKYIGLHQISLTILKWRRRFWSILCSVFAGLVVAWAISHFDLFGAREFTLHQVLNEIQTLQTEDEEVPNE